MPPTKAGRRGEPSERHRSVPAPGLSRRPRLLNHSPLDEVRDRWRIPGGQNRNDPRRIGQAAPDLRDAPFRPAACHLDDRFV